MSGWTVGAHRTEVSTVRGLSTVTGTSLQVEAFALLQDLQQVSRVPLAAQQAYQGLRLRSQLPAERAQTGWADMTLLFLHVGLLIVRSGCSLWRAREFSSSNTMMEGESPSSWRFDLGKGISCFFSRQPAQIDVSELTLPTCDYRHTGGCFQVVFWKS